MGYWRRTGVEGVRVKRRRALQALAGIGVSGGLLKSRVKLPGTRTAAPATHSDGRVVDLVLSNASAWLHDSEGSSVVDPDGTRDRVPAIVHGVSVRVEGSRVVEVRRGPIRGGDQIDLEGQLLLPGLISGHTHVAGGSSTRGLIEGGRSYARPLEIVENDFDDDQLDALTAYNLAELIRSGCTAQLEMSLSLRQARSYARVAERFGARGWVGGMVPGIARLFPIWFGSDDDLAGAEDGTLAEIRANLDFAHALGVGGLVQGMMTPHAADTQTPRTLAAIAAAAAELGTGVHTHLSQGARETATVRRRWGRTPTQWWSDAGLLDGPFFGAHFTAPEWEIDGPILRGAGAVYATCPSAGGAGGASQPWPEAIAAGVSVNIGIDTHSNDMIENLKLAVLYGQARAALLSPMEGSPAVEAPTVQRAIEGCTTVAADALRRPDLGRIEPGAVADLVAVDVSGLLVGAGSPPPEPLHNLLYANGHSVRMVMIDGRPQILEGSFVAEDEGGIVAEGGRVARALWSRLDDEGWFS